MGHIYKKSNGHLIKNSVGHLVKDALIYHSHSVGLYDTAVYSGTLPELPQNQIDAIDNAIANITSYSASAPTAFTGQSYIRCCSDLFLGSSSYRAWARAASIGQVFKLKSGSTSFDIGEVDVSLSFNFISDRFIYATGAKAIIGTGSSAPTGLPHTWSGNLYNGTSDTTLYDISCNTYLWIATDLEWAEGFSFPLEYPYGPDGYNDYCAVKGVILTIAVSGITT